MVDMEQYLIAERFEIRKMAIKVRLIFKGCRIRQINTGAITIDMIEFIAQVDTVLLNPAQKLMGLGMARRRKVKEYRWLAGELVWLEYEALPKESVLASMRQQRLLKLRIHDIIDTNKCLKELKDLYSSIQFSPNAAIPM